MRFAVEAGEEGLRVGPGLHAQAHGADQQREAVAHRRVVVDRGGSAARSARATGSGGRVAASSGCRERQRASRNTAPRGSALVRASVPPMPAASVSHRLRPSPRPPGARGEERLEDARQRLGGDARAAVAHRRARPRSPSTRGGELEASLRRRHLLQRLQRVGEQVVHDLLQRHRVGQHHRPVRGRRERRRDAAGGGSRAASRSSTRRTASSSRTGCSRSPQSRAAPPRGAGGRTTSAARRACARRLADRVARRGEVGRVVVEQPLGGLGVGQHRGQRLVEFVRHAGGEFAQRVEPRHLAQAQQFLRAATALRAGRAASARVRRPRRPPRPRRASTATAARPSRRRVRRRRRTAGCRRPGACGSRTASRAPLRGAGWSTRRCPSNSSAHARRRVGRQRPLGPRHQCREVDDQREARRVRRAHDRVATAGEVDPGQRGAPSGPRRCLAAPAAPPRPLAGQPAASRRSTRRSCG